MLIIPLSHERGGVERLPWVSFAVIALCVFAFFSSNKGEGRAETSERFSAAFLYYLQHPWLEPDPRLLPTKSLEAVDEAVAAEGIVGNPTESPLQQGELDRLTLEWVDATADDPVWRHALVPAAIRPETLISHLFLHGGWAHLLGNLLFLFLTAPFVEDRWGRGLFLGFYLVVGAVAGLGFAAHYPDLYRPLIGASGAIAGVMGAFMVLFARTRMKFFYWVGFAAGTFSAPAGLMLALWGAGEILAARAADAAMPGGALGGTAFWAHVWGFVAGAGLALVMRTPKLAGQIDQWRYGRELVAVDGPPAEQLAYASFALVEQAGDARRAGRASEAWDLLAGAVRNGPCDEILWDGFIDLARELERTDQALPVILGRLQSELQPRRGEAEPELGIGAWPQLVRLEGSAEAAIAKLAGLPLTARTRLVERLTTAGDPAAQPLLATLLGGLGNDSPVGPLLRLLRLAERHASADQRAAVAMRVLAHPELPADTRRELELLAASRV